MALSTRKVLISYASQALDKLDVLEELLYNMEAEADGRQPAITEMTSIILQGTEAMRDLWTLLKERL